MEWRWKHKQAGMEWKFCGDGETRQGQVGKGVISVAKQASIVLQYWPISHPGNVKTYI